MSYQIRYSRAMPRAQVRFRKRFGDVMRDAAGRIAGLILGAAVDGVIPIEKLNSLSVDAMRILDAVFVGRDGRTAIRAEGSPLSPYAKILLEEIGRVTFDVVGAHGEYLERVLPVDVRRWMVNSSRRLSEMMSLDEIRERFPSLNEEDVERVQDLRIFEANPLAEYEAAHTWVDPRGYRLSDRIWRTEQVTRRKLNDLMTDLIASGRGSRDIARLVEQFLIPGRAKIRTNRPYGSDGSYDAMRLARTEIARAANQAAFISSYTNPYINQIEVIRSANGDVTCKICPAHATIGINGERLRAAYSVHAANLAPYHPHCMCRVQAVVNDNPSDVAENLRRSLELSRDVNLRPVMTPLQTRDYVRTLLGNGVWFAVRQTLPLQPKLF